MRMVPAAGPSSGVDADGASVAPCPQRTTCGIPRGADHVRPATVLRELARWAATGSRAPRPNDGDEATRGSPMVTSVAVPCGTTSAKGTTCLAKTIGSREVVRRCCDTGFGEETPGCNTVTAGDMVLPVGPCAAHLALPHANTGAMTTGSDLDSPGTDQATDTLCTRGESSLRAPSCLGAGEVL
mmetsp:Transcript_60597/g.156124  ORF Transcript_60597/g.156124 Transcript_60597/m.156124 type:complete len:184 (-) Transcript_60597:1135-1686(-)